MNPFEDIEPAEPEGTVSQDGNRAGSQSSRSRGRSLCPSPERPSRPSRWFRGLSRSRPNSASRNRQQEEDHIDVDNWDTRSQDTTTSSCKNKAGSSIKEAQVASEMQQYPWGKLFLSMIVDNAEIARSLKLEERDIGELCVMFSEGLRQNRQQEVENRNSMLSQARKEIEDSLLEKELSAASHCQGICPPSFFSDTDKLVNVKIRSDTIQLFMPTRRQFSGQGQGKDGNQYAMPVDEYLEGLTRIQKIAKLSRHEFEEIMLATTTGKAHSLIMSWLRQSMSINEIYRALCLNFDRRLHPDRARASLSVYKAPKSSTLANVESYISHLAQRASEAVPPGPSRTQVFNIEANAALIRSLPPASLTLATNTHQALSSRMGRIPEFHELVRAMDKFRLTIDSDLKVNGVSEKTNGLKTDKAPNSQKGKSGIRSSNSNKPRFNKGPSTFHVQTAKQPQIQNEYRENGQQKNRGQASNPNSTQQKGNNNQNMRGNKSKNNSKQGGGWKPRSGGFQNNSANRATPEYCSLCGSIEHVASEGCKNMKDNGGNIVKVLPQQRTCNLCPSAVSPRLQHPETFCPFRKGGCMQSTN